MIRLFFAIALLFLNASATCAETLRMAVTTSFDNSGLSAVLLPQIKADTGLDVQLLVVGTGQALRLGQAGDVDAVLVHARAAEEAFVAAGHATHRRPIMYNDFVLVGPVADPAGIADAATATQALASIAAIAAPFVSRGDDSGTHKMEQTLWAQAQIQTDEDWYRSVGAGMGAALNVASGMQAYILSDRASWLNFGNKTGLDLLFAGDPVLFNQYAFLPVNPERHPHIHPDRTARLENWLTSPRAKQLIDGYTITGQTVFTFNAE